MDKNEIPKDLLVRLIEGLRSDGWSDEKINDFICYLATGQEKYKPTK